MCQNVCVSFLLVCLQIFTVDWSTCITGLDQMDTADDGNGLQVDSASQWDTTAVSVSQLEAELLGKRLRELLQGTETQVGAKQRKRRMNAY